MGEPVGSDGAAAVAGIERLLRARSIALVGASGRPGSFVQIQLGGLIAGGYGGTVPPVNPGYRELAG